MKYYFLLVISFIWFRVHAQSFEKTVVPASNIQGIYGMDKGDINGNNRMDLVVAATMDNTVSAFVNYDTGFTQMIIDDNLQNAIDVKVYDIDNDGDMDVVACGDSELSWYENTGSLNFDKHFIQNFDHPTHIEMSDIDNNGMGDIGLSVYNENKIYLLLNSGGNFISLPMIDITGSRFFKADCAFDTLHDIAVSSFSEDKIIWYKPEGNTLVPGGTIAEDFPGALGMMVLDLDDDGDDDVIAAAYLGNELAWFENTNGDGSLFIKHSIDTELYGASYIICPDMDDDGDIDIVATGYGITEDGNTGLSQVAYYENDGSNMFEKTIIDDTEQGPAMLCVDDFTEDGEYDVVFAANISNRLILMTGSSTGVISRDIQRIGLYPNPASECLYIHSEVTVTNCKVLDATGKLLIELFPGSNAFTIPAGAFPQGIYRIVLSSENESVSEVFIKK